VTTTIDTAGQHLRTKLTNLVDDVWYRLNFDDTNSSYLLERVLDRVAEIADTLTPSTLDAAGTAGTRTPSTYFESVGCGDCGSTKVTRYADGTCFTCQFWADQFSTPGGLIINGSHYRIGPEPTPQELADHPSHYGCYGDQFVIGLPDGTQTVTHNLWTQGPIPPRLSRPDNAAFIQRAGGTR